MFNGSFVHYEVNLTGCGLNRSCGSMGGAPMLLPEGALGVAFAGGSGIGSDQLRGSCTLPPPLLSLSLSLSERLRSA